MRVVLVTGMSGAGKSAALRIIEDLGFEAVDNLPLPLLIPLINPDANEDRSLVIGCDVRSRDFTPEHFKKIVRELRLFSGLDLKVVLLDSNNEVLRRRFTETRRRHPLALDRPVIDGIRIERTMIENLRDIADIMIDTSDLQQHDLRHTLEGHFAGKNNDRLSLFLTSFSYRKGLPRDADLVFDVRFLQNPHYEPELKPLDGRDARIGTYIEKDKDFSNFFNHLTGLLQPLLPRYTQEGKSYLTIAIGCTGGRHRSVFVTEKLAGFLRTLGYKVGVRHRDVETE